jgi:RecA-family ATPase
LCCWCYSRRQHEELEVEENVEEEAKKLKHEADHEENMEVKCTKYLQVRKRDGID